MQITERGLALIEQFEGYSSRRYADVVGVLTIGFGTTASVVDPVPESCTRQQAEGWLRTYVDRECQPAIDALRVPLNPNQNDALCSLLYNCGPGPVQPGSQLHFDLTARRFGAAGQDLMAYVHAGGEVIQGLVNRRTAERKLFLTPYADPDPLKYAWFDPIDRDLGHGHQGSERAIVEEYDRERAHRAHFPGRLATLQDDLSILAGRLETIIESDPAASSLFHREWRHGQLLGRSQGRRYV